MGQSPRVTREGKKMEITELIREHDFVERGNLLDSKGEYQKAIAAYNHALSIDPADADALFNKGETLVKMGKLAEAQKLFDTAIAMYVGEI